ncbi:adenylate kinase [Marmoricola sp. RAF53]|uniref:adenylate kinase n=1 Tax=Marmoricola sp. RAF53 TaxID=3233059 RepID=UPI003F953CEA
MRLLLMGPPGSGKGTQATRIAAGLGIPAISTGDIFRANVADATPLGRVAREYMDAGEYVPDQVTNAMVRDRLAHPDCEPGFLLDGYPRTLQQVHELDSFLDEGTNRLDAVVELVVDRDVLVDRLLLRARSEGRADDTLDVIRRRQEVYAEQTAPLTAEYAARGLLHAVDGDGQVELVSERITGLLAGLGATSTR